MGVLSLIHSEVQEKMPGGIYFGRERFTAKIIYFMEQGTEDFQEKRLENSILLLFSLKFLASCITIFKIIFQIIIKVYLCIC